MKHPSIQAEMPSVYIERLLDVHFPNIHFMKKNSSWFFIFPIFILYTIFIILVFTIFFLSFFTIFLNFFLSFFTIFFIFFLLFFSIFFIFFLSFFTIFFLIFSFLPKSLVSCSRISSMTDYLSPKFSFTSPTVSSPSSTS